MLWKRKKSCLRLQPNVCCHVERKLLLLPQPRLSWVSMSIGCRWLSKSMEVGSHQMGHCRWSHGPPTRSSAEVRAVHLHFRRKKGKKSALKTLTRATEMQRGVLLRRRGAPPQYRPNLGGGPWMPGAPGGREALPDDLLAHV